MFKLPATLGEGTFELAKMAVIPKAQGKHIGKKLMEAAIGRAKTVGARRVYLETNDMLTPAVNLVRMRPKLLSVAKIF